MKDIEFLQNLGKPLQREEMNLAYVPMVTVLIPFLAGD
jgi:hypothetical protein